MANEGYNLRPFTNSGLSEDFLARPELIENVNKLLGKSKEQLDQLTITTEKFKAALDLEKQLGALYKLGLHTGASKDELKELKSEWQRATQESKNFVASLRGLDPKTIRQLGLETELLEHRNRGLLGRIREVNQEWDDLKRHRVSILAIDKAGSMLSGTLKTVTTQLIGFLGIGGGIIGALTMLRDAYGAAKELGREAHSIGLSMGMIGMGAKKALDPKLFQTVRQSVEELRESYGYTRQESMAMMQAVGKGGVGSPVTTEDFRKLTELSALFQRISGLSPEMTMKVARDGMRRFGQDVDGVSATLSFLQQDAQKTGTDFNEWTGTVMGITGEFEDFGISAEEVSASLYKVYNSSFTAQRGFKMSMSQADELTRVLLKLSRGADVSDEAFAALSGRMNSFKGMPRLKAMQEARRALMSGDKQAITEFTQALEGLLNDAIPGEKDYIRIQRLFETLGTNLDTDIAVNLADAFNRGDLDAATKTVIGKLIPLSGDLAKQMAAQSAKGLQGIKTDPLVMGLILQFKQQGIDDIENFMQRLFNVAMEQALTLEAFIEEGLLTGFRGLLTQVDEWIGKATGITTNLASWSDSIKGVTSDLGDIAKLGAGLSAVVGGLLIGAKFLGKGGATGAKAGTMSFARFIEGMFKKPVNNAQLDDLLKAGGKTGSGGIGTAVGGSAGIKIGGTTAQAATEVLEQTAKTPWWKNIPKKKADLLKVLGLVGAGAVLKASGPKETDFGGSTRDEIVKQLYGSFGLQDPTKLGVLGNVKQSIQAPYQIGKSILLDHAVDGLSRFAGDSLYHTTTDQDLQASLGNKQQRIKSAQDRQNLWRQAGVNERDVKLALIGDVSALRRIAKHMSEKNSEIVQATEQVSATFGATSDNVQKIESTLDANLVKSSQKTVEDFLKLNFPSTMSKIVDRFTVFKRELESILQMQPGDLDQLDGPIKGGYSEDHLKDMFKGLQDYQPGRFGANRPHGPHQGTDFIVPSRRQAAAAKVLMADMVGSGGMAQLDYGNGRVETLHHLSEKTIGDLKQRVGKVIDKGFEIHAMSDPESKRLKKNIGTVQHIHSELRRNGELLGDPTREGSWKIYDEFFKNSSYGTQVTINVPNQEQAKETADYLAGAAPKPVAISSLK